MVVLDVERGILAKMVGSASSTSCHLHSSIAISCVYVTKHFRVLQSTAICILATTCASDASQDVLQPADNNGTH